MRSRKWIVPAVFSILLLGVSVSHGGWQKHTILSEPNYLSWISAEGIAAGPDGTMYIPVGGGYDPLYLLINSGGGWIRETVDSTVGAGGTLAVKVDSSNMIHLFYTSRGNLWYAFRQTADSQWNFELISSESFTRISVALDSGNEPHLAAVQWGYTLMYYHRNAGIWEEETVDDRSSTMMKCSLALDSGDHPVIAYNRDSAPFVAYRQTGGWEFQQIFGFINVTGCAIALNSQDQPRLVFSDKGYIDRVMLASFNGDFWEYTEITEFESTYNMPFPSIVIDDADTLHVAYSDQDNTGTFDVIYVYGDENNLNYEIADDVAAASNSVSLALDPDGKPIIAGFNENNLSLRFSSREQSGWAAQTIDSCYSPRYFSPLENPSLAYDSGGYPHISYQHDYHLYHTWFDGAGWQTELADDENTLTEYQQIAVDSAGNVYIAYNITTIDTSANACLAVKNGSGWSNYHTDDTSQAELFFMDIDIAPDGSPCMAGVEYRQWRPWFFRFNGSSFDGIRVEDNAHNGQYISIAMDDSGLAHLAYLDSLQNNLKYAVGMDFDWTIVTLDNSTYAGYYTSIALDENDNPNISYYSGGLSTARYNGTDWTMETVTAEIPFGPTSMAIDADGYAAMVSSNLIARWDGADWSIDHFNIDPCKQVSMDISPSGVPGIVFFDEFYDLQYISYSEETPEILSMDPAILRQEDAHVTVNLTGADLQDVDEVLFGDGIRVHSWSQTQTQITAYVTVYSYAETGFRDISVSDAEAVFVCSNCLEIQPGPPRIFDVEPGSWAKGEMVTVTVSGDRLAEASVLDFGDGITLGPLDPVSDSVVQVEITIDAGAGEGDRDVMITTPSGSGTCSGCFSVEPAFSGVQMLGIDNLPNPLYLGVPFMIRVSALDYQGRVIPGFSGEITLDDTVTGTLQPNSAELVNGVAQVEATLTTGSTDNQIQADLWTPSHVTGYSNTVDVINPAADCGTMYVDKPVYVELNAGYWNPSNSIDVNGDGTVWIAFGTDNLWVAVQRNGEWSVQCPDDTPGTGSAVSLALDSDGRPHISYANLVTYELRYAHLSDFGWVVETVANWPVFNSSIAVDSTDGVHICYGGASGQFYAVKREGVWSIETLTSASGQESSICLDNLDLPHMVARTTAGIGYWGYSGGTWQYAHLIMGGGEYCSIDTDSANRPHVVCYGYLGGGVSAIFHGYWDNEWTFEQLPNTDDMSDCCLRIDAADRLNLVVNLPHPDGGFSIQYMRQNGTNWDVSLMDPGQDSLGDALEMCMDEAGGVHCQYVNGTSHGLEYAMFSNSEWHRQYLLPSLQVADVGGLTVDEFGGADVAYLVFDSNDSNDWLKVAQLRDGIWEDVPVHSGAAVKVAACEDPGGQLAVVYAEDQPQPGLYYCVMQDGSYVSQLVDSSATDGYTGLNLCYNLSGEPQIVFKQSGLIRAAHRSGAVWAVEDIHDAGYSAPDAQMGSDGLIRMVFDSDEVEWRKIYYCRQTAQGWSSEVVFDEPALSPLMALDSGDLPHIVFIDGDEFVYATKDSEGWQLETFTDGLSSSNSRFPHDVTLDSNGRPLFMYSQYVDTTGFPLDLDMRVCRRADGYWSIYSVDAAGWTGMKGRMAVDAMDNLHFAYLDTSAKDLKYADCLIPLPPEIDRVDPSVGYPGQVLTGVVILGFSLQYASLLDLGDDIQVTNLVRETSTRLTADFLIASDAALGSRDVRVVSPGGEGICTDCFVVLESGAEPEIYSVSPGGAMTGENADVVISGRNLLETSVLDMRSDIIINGFTVPSGEIITANIQIAADAEAGGRDVQVITRSGEAICRECFYVEAAPLPTAEPTSPSTITPTPSPSPSNSPTPSYTKSPTPTPTPSASASFTPSPSPTPTSSHSPTPTPTPSSGECGHTGVTIEMPKKRFYPGDTCNCKALVCNATTTALEGYPLFVILDVYGSYFFAPSFNSQFDTYLNDYTQFPLGLTTVTVLDDFQWPSGVDPLNGINWYGALTDPAITQIVGEWSVFEFGWDS